MSTIHHRHTHPEGIIADVLDAETSRHFTYWNGEPTPARIVRIIVGPSPVATWWCAKLEGTEREAVEVRYAGQPPFYLDNEHGTGWSKVTTGRGSPQWGHSSLPVAKVLP